MPRCPIRISGQVLKIPYPINRPRLEWLRTYNWELYWKKWTKGEGSREKKTALQALNSNFPINHKDVQRDKAHDDRLTDRVKKPQAQKCATLIDRSSLIIISKSQNELSPYFSRFDAACTTSSCISLHLTQVIQIVSAVDRDDPIQGHFFNYRLVPEMLNNPNFTIKNNPGGQTNWFCGRTLSNASLPTSCSCKPEPLRRTIREDRSEANKHCVLSASAAFPAFNSTFTVATTHWIFCAVLNQKQFF